MSEKLKPCPFCGYGKQEVVKVLDKNIYHDVYKVSCPTCGAVYQGSPRKYVVEGWNRRSKGDDV